jgi:hypothetical protein
MAPSSSSAEYHDILNMLKDKEFIGKIIEQMNSVLDQMIVIDRHTFHEYDELVQKTEKFKKALLNYVLNSLVHPEVLKNNFAKKC